jgi:AcrR family transcriptional regulator
MARRKDHSPEELEALVISSVLEYLQAQSANTLSLRHIAKSVGYSPGTLINLFGSYAHLLLAVNACTLDQISERLENKLLNSQDIDAQQQLLVFAEEYLSFAQQHIFQWRLLFEHRLDEEIPDWQQNRINQLFELIELRLSLLAPHADATELQQASRTIWASVHGICMLEVDNKIFANADISGKSMLQSLITHYLAAWKIQAVVDHNQ